MLNKTFVSIYTLQVVMSLIVLIIYGITLFFSYREYKILFVIQSLYIIATMLDINWFFFGMEEFKLTVVRNTIIKIASMISVFVFVKDADDIYIFYYISFRCIN